MATPLINALRVQGGTFLTFTSAVKDIQKTFTDDDARFVFSKYALLDIPDVETPSSNHENYIVWEAIGRGNDTTPYTSTIPTLSTDNDVNFSQSFQNYLLNFEEEILQGTNSLALAYDPTQLYTVSETLLWKWLANINAVRYRSSSAAESVSGIGNRYTEEDGTQYYKRVVKYIGDIDVVNNVSREGTAYSEVYINVPTQHGNTPVVLWKNRPVDTNYAPGMYWNNDNEYVVGRNSTSVHPGGLDLRAYYDDGAKDYKASNSFTDITNFEGSVKVTGGSYKPVYLSKLDGIILDFDPNSYSPIINNGTISSIGEFNSTDAAQNFSFNAALVYYDTYSASNPTNTATNLYGILILDNYVNQIGSASYIKRFDKFKPNAFTKLNGNSFSLKLDIKFDTSVSNAGVETIINDFTTISMDLFLDASNQLQTAADTFLTLEPEVIDLKTRMDSIEQFYYSQDQLDAQAQRISQLESDLNNAKLAYASSSTLLDLINVNADNINQILSGNLSVNLTYNTDVLGQSDGIYLDKSVPNIVSISNTVQTYNSFSICSNLISVSNPKGSLLSTIGNGIGTNLTGSYSNNILSFGKFGNYYKQYSDSHSNIIDGIEVFDDNLFININDYPVRWKKGQTFRIVFENPIDPNSYSIYIKTDSIGRLGNGNYGVLIGIIPYTKISSYPILEIICTDENLYTFNIDIIK